MEKKVVGVAGIVAGVVVGDSLRHFRNSLLVKVRSSSVPDRLSLPALRNKKFVSSNRSYRKGVPQPLEQRGQAQQHRDRRQNSTTDQPHDRRHKPCDT
jgi:hypothetical protein